jgi:hypothetical protein
VFHLLICPTDFEYVEFVLVYTVSAPLFGAFFNDAVSSSDCVASSDGMVNE